MTFKWKSLKEDFYNILVFISAIWLYMTFPGYIYLWIYLTFPE